MNANKKLVNIYVCKNVHLMFYITIQVQKRFKLKCYFPVSNYIPTHFNQCKYNNTIVKKYYHDAQI